MEIRKLTLLITLFMGVHTLNGQDASLSPASLNETGLLSGENLTVQLTGAQFTHTGPLTVNTFLLQNAPGSLGINSIVVTASNRATVVLQATDFDQDYNYFHIFIPDSILDVGSYLYTDTCVLVANIERAVLSSSPLPLSERNIGTGQSAYLQINMIDEEFLDASSLVTGDFTLVNFPAGVSITDFAGPPDQPKPGSVRFYITYSPGDFDSPINDAAVIINDPDLLRYSTDTLGTTAISILALTESVTFNSSQSLNLNEKNLDDGVVVVDLINDETTDTGPINISNLGLVNFPTGTSIEFASSNGTRITINLAFDGTDFDADDTNGQIQVKSSILKWNRTSDLYTPAGAITITSTIPTATVTPSSWPREFFLDTMSLRLMLIEDEFDPGETPGPAHFGFLNGPAGLSVGGVADLTTTAITLLLNYNGTDFDNSFGDVRVSINSTILVSTSPGPLLSEPFTIDPNIEPVVSSVSIPDVSMKIGDLVQATINLSGSIADSAYTLAGGTIGGYPLVPGSLQKVSGSQYRARFTVTEGGNSYLAGQSIPVSGLRLNDLPVTGVLYNGNISQDHDLLDAQRPVVSSLNLIGQGDKQIGDQVVLLIFAAEVGLLPEDSTEINGVPVTQANVTFEEIGGGSYSLIYTIETGDRNVATGALEAKVYLRDPAGNVNSTCPAIAPNILSIDANVPLIYSTTNTTPSDTVIIGEEVVLTVEADGSGYQLSGSSSVNGVRKNEGLLFSSSGTTYTIRYPVKESHPSAAAGQLKASIILEDASGNPSLPDTVILGNDVAVLTQRPTALLVLGDEICINDTGTVYITLGGAPPWKLKIRTATDSVYIGNILSPNFSFKTAPVLTTDYSIDSVWDGTGNRNIGFGNVQVTVHPLPVVDIANLAQYYAVTNENEYQLLGIPAGGDFFGPGVNSLTGGFTPAKAGLSLPGSPHWIFYEYRDENFCFNVDSQSVEILPAEVDFIWPDTFHVACYLNREYLLEARNTALTTGKFSIVRGTYPDGFYRDNGDNTVTFFPSLLEWKPGQDYSVNFTIQYDYINNDAVPLFDQAELAVEYFEPAYIDTRFDSSYCSNENAFPLRGTKSYGLFHGPGVDSLGNFEYEFNPAIADTGSNLIVYSFRSNYGCEQFDTAMAIVHQSPDPEFEFLDSCVLINGGNISFRNLSDTGGLGGTLEWEWNYGDIQSGERNSDVFPDMRDGSHDYPRPGNRGVTLTAEVLETGCISSHYIEKYIGNTPVVSIDWNTDCFTGGPTVIQGSSVTEDGQSYYSWRITDRAGTELLAEEGQELDLLNYQFGSIDNYGIELTATSARGCFTSVSDTIYLRPYIRNITESAPYSEDFESGRAGWFAFGKESSPQMSWKLGTVAPGEFPYDLPGEGSHAWYTDLVRTDTSEQSWVISPCYDFSDMRRPMISLDRKVSSDRDRDGAALQYSYDDGDTWHNVGAIEDGSINWYNSFRIQDGPGGQGEGWTGGFVFDKFEPWKQSRHELDELTGRTRVQFRIAYGSSGESLPQIENQGFAFDNVWIGERSRVVLIEHFTNSGMAESNEANDRINRLVRNNPLDVIDLQYHAEVSGFTDRMNQDNPAPASARSLFYGTRQVPYMLMDGGNGGLTAYDFGTDDLDTLDLFARALTDPSFSIGLNVEKMEGGLTVGVELEALDSMPDGEYIVYTVVVERIINDPAYAGAGGITEFENVVRAMVPNAAGISLIRAWDPGEKESVPLSWDISDKVLDQEMLIVVAFVQDAASRMIYQAASNDPDLNGDPVIHTTVPDLLRARNLSMLIYPNPAADMAYIAFSEAAAGPVELQLFSHTGTLVWNKVLPGGTEVYEMDLWGLEKGVYLMRAIRNGMIIGTKKLMIIH